MNIGISFNKKALAGLCVMLGTMSHADTYPMPVHQFEVSCDFYLDEEGNPLTTENEALHSEVSKAVVDLVNFAEEYQGQAVYLEFAIEASNSAGYCMMFDDHLEDQLPDNVTLRDIDRAFGLYILDSLPAEEHQQAETEPAFSMWARTAGNNAGSMSIRFGTEVVVPDDGLFTTGKFGHLYYFSGPVVFGYRTGNGADSAWFRPLGNSQFLWKEVAEIRNSLWDEQISTE